MDREFWISELTDEHLPAVIALCRNALDLPEDATEAAEIVRRLRETGPRRTGFLAVAPGERVIGVVLGSVSHRDASIGHVDLIAVDPAERRRGIGRALMTRVEGALAGLGADDVVLAGNAPHYAWPGIDVRYTPAICAAMALGFAQDQPAWNMTADLRHLRPTSAAEERLAGEGVTIRRAEPADSAGLAEFALANWGSGWAGEITDSIGRDRAGCHIAVEKDGTLLGFAAYGSSRPSWFGPMGTTAAARGRGIGSILLRRCLADQRDSGLDSAQIGWVGPVPFYSSAVGARVERVFFLYRKQL
ncbi:GNAT family N-acetyltransferase [Paractinoplanes toevensis]|uniref:GNAT family acetyltransferase n=1 Tax=Paractinoplanes toevensis TaxID=571911 RepID=A0A919TDY9_9ACTN|nr:GNAT family N-acetyltransferase [Actinoplanes toevensis]GIM93547.1 GNAT family acetyltransferase [Actinoplanes toevensis]